MRIYPLFAIVATMLAFAGIASAPTAIWDNDADFASGQHEGTQNVSGDIIINDTQGVYGGMGSYTSSIEHAYDPVVSVVPSWTSTEPDENVNITIEVSVNGGYDYCLAENHVEINSSSCQDAGFGTSDEIIFRANLTTNDTSVTPELHDVTLEYEMKTPYMEADLAIPYDNTLVGRYKNMTVNASITCMVHDCGLVNATARYNSSSSTPDTKIGTSSGQEPFYIISGNNTRNCTDVYLKEGETCNISWKMNVTGPLSSIHEIDAVFMSNRSTVQSNDTDDATVEIGKVMIIDVGFSEVDFGVLDPGTEDEPAIQNSQGYNITVDTNSNNVENIWIKGSNLTIDDGTGLECGTQTQYNPYDGNTTRYPCKIDVSQISWSLERLPGEQQIYPLSGSYKRLNKDMQVFGPGESISTYYWADIPFGIYAGAYTGDITIMANATW